MSGENAVEPLSVEDVLASLVESGEQRVIVPKKGPLFDDQGRVKVAIIRPCVSRGKRLRGLPPIYTPEMLGENARVFRGWPMFVDHKLAEAVTNIVEARRAPMLTEHRSVLELGGRIVESWWDPNVVFEDDEEYGYQKGGVVGYAIPQRPIREMIETDPDLLHCSINAWPTGAKPGERWGTKGMLVEGIRSKPPGSVDWVIRGGAGGRVLREDEDFAVSILEGFYDAAQPEQETMSDLSKMTLAQLQEHLREKNPQLAEQLQERVAGGGGGPVTITIDQVQEMLDAQEARLQQSFEETLTEREEDLTRRAEERADELVSEREQARTLSGIAFQLIEAEKAKLTPRMLAELKARYSVLPSGPASGLLVEAKDDKTAEDVLREQVAEDLQHAIETIEEARGGPAVRGLGGRSGNDGPSQKGEDGRIKVSKGNTFNSFLAESGTDLDKLVNGEKVQG